MVVDVEAIQQEVGVVAGMVIVAVEGMVARGLVMVEVGD